MKRILITVFFACLSVAVLGQSLAYQWKPNASYKFRSIQNDKVSMGGSGMMGMMAMSGDMEFKTESVFTLKINKVNPDGSALGTFYLNSFRVTDNAGNTMANMASLPVNGIKSDFLVTRKGDFSFFNLPMIVSRETGNLLVSTKIKKGGMATTATAQVDGEKVTLFAEFNPKTGALKGGYSSQTINQPKPKPVTIKQDDETIDLIPTEFLDLLVLPKEPVSIGKPIKVRMYDTEITEKVISFNQNVAKINYDIKSALSARKFEQDAKKMAGENDTEEMNSNDGMEMEADIPGMDTGGTPNIAQEMNGNINIDFDNGKGMMNSVNGTIKNTMNMMGMEMKTTSNLKMNLIP